MDKSEYQLLRWSIESHVHLHVSDPVAARALCNEIMRDFLRAMATSQLKQASGKRALRTFRRDASVKLPSWAIRNPSISSRLPTL